MNGDSLTNGIVSQHPIYWFEDGSFILDVQTQQYKVHKTLLSRHSKYFSRVLAAVDGTTPGDNLSQTKAVHRPALLVQQRDVETLLQHLYHDAPVSQNSSLSRLVSIIRISSPRQFDFPALHTSFCQTLETLFQDHRTAAQSLNLAQDPTLLHEAFAIASEFKLLSARKGLLYALVTTTDFVVSDQLESATRDESPQSIHMHANSVGNQSDSPHPRSLPSAQPATEPRRVELLKEDADTCMSLMTQLIEHFSPILFTVPPAGHMECTDCLASQWMTLTIQPALEDDGVYKPLETLQRIKDMDWESHGLCSSCVKAKRDEWTEEQERVWKLMDKWLANGSDDDRKNLGKYEWVLRLSGGVGKYAMVPNVGSSVGSKPAKRTVEPTMVADKGQNTIRRAFFQLKLSIKWMELNVGSHSTLRRRKIPSRPQPTMERKDGDASSFPKSLSPPTVKYMKWGIFDIAFQTVWPTLRFPTREAMKEIPDLVCTLTRFLGDVGGVASTPLLEYIICHLWMSLSLPLSLVLAHQTLSQALSDENRSSEGRARHLAFYAFLWMTCGISRCHAEQQLLQQHARLGRHLRAHFLPRLVEASLYEESSALPGERTSFPYSHEFGNFVPGWDSLHKIFSTGSAWMSMACTTGAVVSLLTGMTLRDAVVSTFILLIFFIEALVPRLGRAGGVGYTFWTNDEKYNRLMALFNMAFNPGSRKTLVKDGNMHELADEYRDVSAAFGTSLADPSVLAWSMPQPWYWNLIRQLTNDYALALYVFILSADFTLKSIHSAAMLQYSIYTLRKSLDSIRHDETLSVYDAVKRLDKLYNILDRPPTVHSTHVSPLEKGAMNGPRIVLRNVHFTYLSLSEMGPTHQAICGIDLDILPGQLIYIVGPNGSGKSTLLALLSGMILPTRGEVYVDGRLLTPSEGVKLRRKTAFSTLEDAIYPISLMDNVLPSLGLRRSSCEEIEPAEVEKIISDAGCSELFQRLGSDRIVNPCGIVSYSHRVPPGRAALDALDRNSPAPRQVSLSTGEKQRLMICRALMKARHGDTTLVLLDESTNALDAPTERRIFSHFCAAAKQRRQTMIVVTHRPQDLAVNADRIIVMENGRVSAQGTHEEMKVLSSFYASLLPATPN